MDDVVDFDETVKPARRWKPIIAAGVAVLAVGVGLLASSDLTRTIGGVPVANALEVSLYAEDVKSQELAAAQAAEEQYVAGLELETLRGLQDHFADADLPWTIHVSAVSLVRTLATTFDGLATMQMDGYSVHQVTVNVTADGRKSIWEIPEGALLPLFG